MRWLDPPLALALDGANRRIDQGGVLIDSMASNYWIDIA
jgi:hypothetical protein